MKKTLLSLLFALPFLANAQFSENFDAAAAMPAGWSIINGGDANGFLFIEGAPGSALSLNNAAQINFSATAHDDYLITPAINVMAGISDRLTYFVKSQDPAYLEDYAVKLSTSTATAAAFTNVLKASSAAPGSWTPYSIDLSAYVGQTVYIGFHATSTDQFRLMFDNVVNDTAPTVLPQCPASLTAPANNATDVAFASVTFSWTAPAAGGPVEYYEVYADTTANPTTKVGTFVGTTGTVANLLSGTTYFWKVVAVNGAGVSTACTVNTFMTKVDPLAPYCGPLTFSSGVEPITSVNFGGMTNTSPAATTSSPHEVFTDKIATVEQGKPYTITLKGNTDGSYTARFLVFIDWNQDGDFLDAGETYFSTGTAVTINSSTGVDAKVATGSIAVPAGATLGNTRMRVKKNFGTTLYPNPCFSAGTLAAGTTAGYGQAEDYTVNVIAPPLAASNATKSQLSVYPNPVKDILNITTADRKVTEVTFYSADGKLVKSVTENVANVNVSSLPKGVYIVKVKTSDSEKSFKVIKE